MMSIITVAIGIILVYLILSLVATSAQEVVASWFSLRSRTMGEALERMLSNESVDEKVKEADLSLLNKFTAHARYDKMRPELSWYHRLFSSSAKHPSYMSATAFASILLHILDGSDVKKLQATIHDMNDGKLKQYLTDLLSEADNDLAKFRKALEDWYNEMMDRASGWYKRHVHNILLVLGFLIASFFNGDTITIYEKMSGVQAGSAQEEQLLALAQDYVDGQFEDYFQAIEKNRAVLDTFNKQPDSLRDVAAVITQDSILRSYADSMAIDLTGVNSPLGLGWTTQEWDTLKAGGIQGWLLKFIGIFITTLAISLGAPFWFDLLQSAINIRNAGKLNVAPKEKEGGT
jgi:hypothetical protein